jgi:hypothetical protein
VKRSSHTPLRGRPIQTSLGRLGLWLTGGPRSLTPADINESEHQARRFAVREEKPVNACDHENVTRLRPLYVDGRPLYKCDDCGARFVYEDDETSTKALAPIREKP